MSIKEQIPIGSKWQWNDGFSKRSAREVHHVDSAYVKFTYNGDSNEWMSETAWWLANMRRIDVPATFAPPACPTCRCWTNSVCADAFHIADAPAPKAEVCGFPIGFGQICGLGAGDKLHRGCGKQVLMCDSPGCHLFVGYVPAVSKTETPAAVKHVCSLGCLTNGCVAAKRKNPPAPPVLKHDFSDRYCRDETGLLCKPCGEMKRNELARGGACVPVPGWREAREVSTAWAMRNLQPTRRQGPPPTRHFAQPPLSHGLQMGGGSMRCACARCRP